MNQASSQRRDSPRIDLRLRVRYMGGQVHGEAEASDVSMHGLRLESDQQIAVGEKLQLMVDTGESASPSYLDGEVTWCRPHNTPTGRTVYDVGVKLNAEGWHTPEMGRLGSALARLFALREREQVPVYTQTPCALDDGTPVQLSDVEVNLLQFTAPAVLQGKVTTGSTVTVEIDAEDAKHVLTAKVAWVSDQQGGKQARFKEGFALDTREAGAPLKALLARIKSGQSTPTRLRIKR